FGAHLVRGDSIRIEAAGLRVGVKDHGVVAKLTQLERARQACRSGPDQSNTITIVDASFKKLRAVRDHGIDSIALQLADLDRLLAFIVEDTRAFAEDRSRADSRTALTENIGRENCFGRAAQVSGDDLANEQRHVDARGARFDAWRVVTEQAARSFF